MKAAFGLRFLPAFFAFFFAISGSPLNDLFGIADEVLAFAPGSPATRRSGDVKMPKKLSRVNAFHSGIATLSLDSRVSATPRT
jgi:hypothetical protein